MKMKLLTHNMLTSHMKGVKNGYPFRILVRVLPVLVFVTVYQVLLLVCSLCQ